MAILIRGHRKAGVLNRSSSRTFTQPVLPASDESLARASLWKVTTDSRMVVTIASNFRSGPILTVDTGLAVKADHSSYDCFARATAQTLQLSLEGAASVIHSRIDSISNPANSA